MNIGGGEIIGLFLLALLLFGPKRLPEIGRNLGNAMRELRRMSNEVTSAFTEAMEEPSKSSSSWVEGSADDPYATSYNDSREWEESDETSGEELVESEGLDEAETTDDNEDASGEAAETGEAGGDDTHTATGADEPRSVTDPDETDNGSERNMTYGSD